jgi:3,4-dihydroxy 2-butanone 4-phosphate synthase/GTP cyclohydrolase II
VLVRAGHTEASVDISRLAGLYPAAVICEIMNDDGTMARLPELVTFAQLHGLKIGTIADLIAWRRRHDRFLERRIEGDFESAWGGKFRIDRVPQHAGWRRTRRHREGPHPGRPAHAGAVSTGSTFCQTCSARLATAKALSAARWRKLPPPTSPASPSLSAWEWARKSRARLAANMPLPADEPAHPLREYGVGAQILKDLGVRRMIHMSNTRPNVLPGLDGYGLTVEGWRRIDGD